MPDLAQAVIMEIVHDINVDAYMDNCMLFTDKDFKHHVGLIDKLLSVIVAKIQSNLQANLVKILKRYTHTQLHT